METPAIRNDLNSSYGLDLPEATSIEALEAILAERINALIMDDFNRLVQLLYRVDVDEGKLKNLLRENTGTNAGLLIARLILERQRQKIEIRRKFGP
jgi:hypothetical protein